MGQFSKIPSDVQTILNQAKVYYDVSLFDESKSILLKLLHSDKGRPYEAEIRYHLGLACYYSNNVSGANLQWKQLITKFPTNMRSKQLNRILANFTDSIDSTNFMREEDFEYSNDLQLGRLFWSPAYMNAKLFWSELKDPAKAVAFYNSLVEKYDDPKKKFKCLYYTFLLEAGINNDRYGWGNLGLGSKQTAKQAQKNRDFFRKSQNFKIYAILESMEQQITDELIDPNYGTLIQSYYMAGVKVSGSSIFTGSVKVNEMSKTYFDKVLELTKNDEYNIYRIFTKHWLNI